MPPIPPDQQAPYGGEAPTASAPEPIELWERATVLKFFGGDKPLHISTLYRGVHTGRYPRPVYVSDNSVRWVGHECRAARNACSPRVPNPSHRRSAAGSDGASAPDCEAAHWTEPSRERRIAMC